MSAGSAITLRSLFDCGSYEGGQQEAQAAYDEAVNAVFNLQVECHRHAQPHISKKDGRTKWAMIEMWPMQVCLPHSYLQFLSKVERPEVSGVFDFSSMLSNGHCSAHDDASRAKNLLYN